MAGDGSRGGYGVRQRGFYRSFSAEDYGDVVSFHDHCHDHGGSDLLAGRLRLRRAGDLVGLCRPRLRANATTPGTTASPGATPAAAAAPEAATLNTGDNAWVLTSSALVLMMTGPGLGPVLLRAGAQEERAERDDAVRVPDGHDDGASGPCTATRWSSAATEPWIGDGRYLFMQRRGARHGRRTAREHAALFTRARPSPC